MTLINPMEPGKPSVLPQQQSLAQAPLVEQPRQGSVDSLNTQGTGRKPVIPLPKQVEPYQRGISAINDLMCEAETNPDTFSDDRWKGLKKVRLISYEMDATSLGWLIQEVDKQFESVKKRFPQSMLPEYPSLGAAYEGKQKDDGSPGKDILKDLHAVKELLKDQLRLAKWAEMPAKEAIEEISCRSLMNIYDMKDQVAAQIKHLEQLVPPLFDALARAERLKETLEAGYKVGGRPKP